MRSIRDGYNSGPSLLGLLPLGLGTSRVESLASYFLRLSEVHCLLPRDFAGGVVAPAAMATMVPGEQLSISAFIQVVSRGRSTMNGPGDAAQRWVRAITEKTRQPDLDLLTLLPWRTQVSTRGLMANGRRFCSACFFDWQEANEPARELLLWTLANVTVCPSHGIPLRERCPHLDCGKLQPHLSSIARAGLCFWCDQLLALRSISEGTPLDQSCDAGDLPWGRFVADRVGQVLVDGARARSAGLPAMTSIMSRLIESAGGTTALSMRIGVSKATVAGWRFHTPTLENLLRISRALRVPVADIMLGAIPVQLVQSAPASVPPKIYRLQHGPRRRIDWVWVRTELERALVASDVVPQRTVMARLNVDPSATRKRYPDLCHALGKRAAQARHLRFQERRRRLAGEVRAAVADLEAKGIHASRRQVEAMLRHVDLRERPLAAAWHDSVNSIGTPEHSADQTEQPLRWQRAHLRSPRNATR